ncbi:MAG: B12-binding domain-containing radical SAM protein [Endomicrobiales bacterium]|nr:B12-binding domain-containing radical SAM protein [Endomicrobiales bacterium]
MKITFVHQGKENLGIEALSSFLKQEGHEVSLVLDLGLFGPTDNIFYSPFLESVFSFRGNLLAKIEKTKPDVVGFSVYTGTYPWALSVADMIKKRTKIPTLFGGIHATLTPETVIQRPEVDFLIEGEGEYPLGALMSAIRGGEDFGHIEGLWYKKQGRIIRNKSREAVNDINDLPIMDKQIFERYADNVNDYIVLTNRGCRCSCTYCCEFFMNNKYRDYRRRRKVDSVMEELKTMNARYGFKAVRFTDSIFFEDKEWLREFLERYRKEIGVPFRCFGHVYFFDDEVARLLKEAGCYSIEFGLQTLNERIRTKTLRCLGSNEHVDRAFRLCEQHGIKYDIDHMFGLPGESEGDHKKAAEYYIGLKNLNRIKCHNLTYFPKLQIINAAKEAAMLTDEDIADIENGKVGNFVNIEYIKDKRIARINRGYKNLFKLLPLLPKWMIRPILKGRMMNLMALLPSVFVMAGQLAIALVERDFRFLVYLKLYPKWVLRSIYDAKNTAGSARKVI